MQLTPEVKRILEHVRVALVLEDGKPAYVICDVEMYVSLVGPKSNNLATQSQYNGNSAATESAVLPKEVVNEINQELERIAATDFFKSGLTESPAPKNPATRFYREPQ